MQERLQKVLSSAGVASRREAENLISNGKVTVNGQVVKELGAKVDPEQDHITVNGKRIARDVEPIYIAFHKPRGYVTTRKDPNATNTVMDLILPPLEERFGRNHPGVKGLHPVGRLDAQSEGLLLLTNDGAFTNAATHPSHRVTKLYMAEVKGIPDEAALEKLRAGIPLFGHRTLPARVRITRADRHKGVSTLEVEIREGRQQQVRRMLQAVGHPVDRLKRVAVGPVRLDRLKLGQWRFLTAAEVKAIFEAIDAPEQPFETPEPRPYDRPDPRETSSGREGRGPARPRADRPDGGDRRPAGPGGPARGGDRYAGGSDRPRGDARGGRPGGGGYSSGGSRGPGSYGGGTVGRSGPGAQGPGPRGPRPPQRPSDERGSRDFRGGYEGQGPRGGDFRGGESRGPRGGDFRGGEGRGGDFRGGEGRGGDFRGGEGRGPRPPQGPREFGGDRGSQGPRDFRGGPGGPGPRDARGDRGPGGPRDFRGEQRDFRGDRGPQGPREFGGDRGPQGPREYRGGQGGPGPRDFRGGPGPQGPRPPRDFRGGPGPGGRGARPPQRPSGPPRGPRPGSDRPRGGGGGRPPRDGGRS